MQKNTLQSINNIMICQKCLSYFPVMTIYFDIEGPKLEIDCICQKTIQKISLKDYFKEYNNNALLLNSNCTRNNKHKNEKGVAHCKECDQVMCKECYEEHKELYNINFHSVISKDFQPIVLCDAHKDINKYYCKQCKISICEQCKEEKHKNHEIVDTTLIEKEIQESKIENKVKELYNKIIIQNDTIFNEFMNEIKNKHKDCELFINQLTKSYKENKEVNRLLNSFITILFDNVRATSPYKIYNLFSSIRNNTRINSELYKRDESKSFLEQLSSFNLYLHNNYLIEVEGRYKKYHCCFSSNQHKSSVDVIIQLQDGRLVSGSEDSTINFWDVKEYKCIKTIKAHKEGVYCLHQLKNGYLVSGSADSKIKVWNTITYQCISVLEGHEDCIWVFMELDNGTLISVSEDQLIIFWNTSTWVSKSFINDKFGKLLSSLVLFDDRFAAGSLQTVVKIWDLSTYKCVGVLEGHKGGVNYILQLEDGRLATASGDGNVMMWDVFTLKCLGTLKGHTMNVESLMQAKDGRLVSSSWDDTIRFWDINTYQCVYYFVAHDEKVFSLIMLYDGKFASGSSDSVLKIWEEDEE